jgi:hypothetical protein
MIMRNLWYDPSFFSRCLPLVLLSWSIVTDSDNPQGPEDIPEEMGDNEQGGGSGGGQVDDREEPLVRYFIFFALVNIN